MNSEFLFIINKAGGLIYYEEASEGSERNINELIFLGGTFEGIVEIIKRITVDGGKAEKISKIVGKETSLHCMMTATGLKILLVTKKKNIKINNYLKEIYKIYSDYVMKNPFYILEMPIKSKIFEEKVKRILDMIKDDQK